jgi:hypothetical protein
MANNARNLRSHTVLGDEGVVRISLEHQALEERPVKVVALALLDCELIIVYFRAELSVRHQNLTVDA